MNRSSTSSLLWSVGLLAAGLFAGLAWMWDSPDSEPLALGTQAELTNPSEETRSELAVSSSSVRVTESREELVAESPESESAGQEWAGNTAEWTGATLDFHAKVVLVEADGREWLFPGNSVYLELAYTGDTRSLRTHVRGGRLRLRLREDTEGHYAPVPGDSPMLETFFPATVMDADMTIDRVTLASGEIYERTGDTDPLGFGSELAEIRLYRLTAGVLNVLDAASGAPVQAIQVLPSHSMRRTDPGHPGQLDDWLVHDFPNSPITLDPDAFRSKGSRSTFWIRAAGYAWRRFEIDWDASEPHTARLERAGSLTLQMAGIPTHSEYRLTVSRGHEVHPYFEDTVASDGTFTYEGVRPGRYAIVLDQTYGMNTPGTESLEAHGSVEVRAGKQASVLLGMQNTESLDSLHVTGTLFVPSRWPAESLEAECARLGWFTLEEDKIAIPHNAFVPEPGNPRAFRFDIGALLPGSYQLQLPQHGIALPFRVAPGVPTNIEFRIPEPVRVQLTVLEKETKRVTPINSLQWRKESDFDRVYGRNQEFEALADSPGRFTIELQPGAFHIPQQVVSTHLIRARTVNAKGDLDVELESSRLSVLEIRFQRAGTLVEPPKNLRLRTRSLAGIERHYASQRVGKSIVLMLDSTANLEVFPHTGIVNNRLAEAQSVKLSTENRAVLTFDLGPEEQAEGETDG